MEVLPQRSPTAGQRRRRIAFVAPGDSRDKGAWSGMLHAARGALKKRFDVVEIGAAGLQHHFVDRGIARSYGFVTRPYLPDHGAATSMKWGKAITTALRRQEVDGVVSVAASTLMAFARIETPVVAISDSTFPLVYSSYPQYAHLSAWAVQQAMWIERRSWQRSDACVTTSQWATDSLIRDYAIKPDKCHVIPFGPGIERQGPRVKRKLHDPVRLLVVARDWTRKRGDRALSLQDELERRGIRTQLLVVGAVPPGSPAGRPNVTWLGRLEATELAHFYSQCDVLLELADANCASVTLTDAVSWGLPVVATDVGATREIIRDGVTGAIVPVSESVVFDAAQALERLVDPCFFEGLPMAFSGEVESRRNWDAWARSIEDLLSGLWA